jgi:hypothetical protein
MTAGLGIALPGPPALLHVAGRQDTVIWRPVVA